MHFVNQVALFMSTILTTIHPTDRHPCFPNKFYISSNVDYIWAYNVLGIAPISVKIVVNLCNVICYCCNVPIYDAGKKSLMKKSKCGV